MGEWKNFIVAFDFVSNFCCFFEFEKRRKWRYSRLLFALFFFLFEEIEEKREKEKRSSIHFLLPPRFSRFLFFVKESGKRNWIHSFFLNKNVEKREKERKKWRFSCLLFILIPFFILEIEEEEEREKECEFFLFRRGRKKCNYIPLIFLSKRIKGRGRRRDSHFSIGILKEEKWRRQGRKGDWFRSPFSPFSLVKKEEKKEKNEDVRVVSSLFFLFLGKWRRKRRSKKGCFVLYLRKLGRKGERKE